MRLLKILPLILLSLALAACKDEEHPDTPTLPIRQKLAQVVTPADNPSFNAPAGDAPESHVINSLRQLADLPEGTVSEAMYTFCSEVDFAKYSLVVTTAEIYTSASYDADGQVWYSASANYELTADYRLIVTYTNADLRATAKYPVRCLLQFAFTTDRLPADCTLTLTERLSTDK